MRKYYQIQQYDYSFKLLTNQSVENIASSSIVRNKDIKYDLGWNKTKASESKSVGLIGIS